MILKNRIRALAVSLLLAFCTGTCCISSAEDTGLETKSVTELETLKTKNNLKLQNLQSSIEKARKEYENASRTESVRKEYRDRLSEKISLQNQTLECLVRQINMLEAEAQNTDEMLTEIESQMALYREESDETLDQYRKRIRADYMAGNDNLSAILTGSTSFFDVLTRAELISRVARKDSDTLAALEGKLEKLHELDEQLIFKKEIMSENLEEAEIKKAELDEKLEELRTDYDQTQAELVKLTGEKINFKKDFDTKKAALDEQQKEQEKIASAIKTAMEKLEEQARKQAAAVPAVGGSYHGVTGASQINVASGSTNMLWPVPGYTSHSSFYGYREFDNSDHKAIDIQGNENDTIEFAKIYAAESGTVVTATNYCTHSYGKSYSCGCGGGYGNYIVIQHSDGVYQTVYAHCYTVYVSEGDTVRKGQLIGLVGSTGYSTGPHLHFEVRKNGEKTNPDSYTYINYG